MNVPSEDPLRAPGHREPTAVHALIAITAFIGTVTLVALVVSLGMFGWYDQPVLAMKVLAAAILLSGGCTACGLMIAAITVIHWLQRLSEQSASLEQRTAILAERSVAQARDAGSTSGTFDPSELLRLLADIRDTLVLPADQRQRRFQNMFQAELQKRLADAETFVASGDFHRARAQLKILTARFGPNDRIRAVETQVEKAARAAQEQDVRHARERIKDLMGLNQWDQAERLARELADKYPTAAEPLGFIEHVCRERQLYEQRHRNRLHDEIQQFVHQRRWQEAAQAARQFIGTFPVGPDTEALQVQLETLEANAEIQTRQELEQQIKECIRQKQYWDALALARRIMADYPFSPQANALRAKLPRLEELARNQTSQT